MADDDDRWTVRGVPKAMREAVVDAARRRRVQVGEWACEAFDRHIRAEREPLDMAVADKSADRSDVLSDADARLALIERAVASAVALASAPGVPAGFRRRANRLLREGLPVPVGRVAAGNGRRLAIAGPGNANGAGHGVGEGNGQVDCALAARSTLDAG
jgi:hypothetical protein